MSLFSKVKETLHTGKDVSIAALARKLLQERFGKYGQIEDLSIDTRSKQIRVSLLLTGERESISVAIHRYELVKASEGYYLIVREASGSRPWLNHALDDFLIGKRLPLPEKHSDLVARLL